MSTTGEGVPTKTKGRENGTMILIYTYEYMHIIHSSISIKGEREEEEVEREEREEREDQEDLEQEQGEGED